MFEEILQSCFVVGLLTFIIYTVFLYSKKGIFWIRYFKAKQWIRSYLQRYEKKFTFKRLKLKDASPYDVGLIPYPHEYDIENTCIGRFKHCDGIHFSGFNFEGNFLTIYFNRSEGNLANVWILFKLSNGDKYQLPNSQDTRVPFIKRDYGFYSSGLQIKCLAPLRTWRIFFNGLLQKTSEEDDDLEKAQMIHVKFSFLFYKLQDRYEQWGQLMGTIQIKDKDPMEMYMWSNRTRLLESSTPFHHLSRTILLSYFEDGFPLKVENLCVPNYLTNFTSGYTINEDGAACEIKKCTFEADLIAESSKAHFSFTNFGLQKSRTRNVTINVTGAIESFNLRPDLEMSVTVKHLKLSMEDDIHGVGVLYCFKKFEPSEKHYLPKPLMLLEDSVISFDDERCRSSLTAGGKGCSLSLLTCLSKDTTLFDVPKGFVITTSAFNQHIKTNPSLNYAVQRVINVSCKKWSGDVKVECNKCGEEFRKSKLSNSLKMEIQEMLFKTFKTDSSNRYSIRSSASDEDGEDYSAAGQMLTVLGVSGLENIFKAIIECWSSKFGFEAVQYARQNGMRLRSSMAVVVQEMIPSEISGVLFTVDPVTGDPSCPHITANYGLGETVVSSLAEPDTIVLNRRKDFLEVKTRIIGSKKTQVHMKDDGGTVQHKFDNEIPASCLSDEWSIKIGSIGIYVESCYCTPLDIEWACYKNKLYLLQARPVTALHTETEFELSHDQDTPIRSLNYYWTRANLGEILCGATTPLAISVTAGVIDLSGLRIRFQFERLPEKDYCPYLHHIMPVTHKQVAMNLIDALFRANDKEVTNLQKAFELSLFGREVGFEEIHKIAVKKYGYKSRAQLLIRLVSMFILTHYFAPRNVKKVEKVIRNFVLPIENYTTVEKTWEGILKQITLMAEVSWAHGLTTSSSSFNNFLVLSLLARKKKEWSSELYCDFSTLLSACSNIESADVPESLHELARIIAKSYGSTFTSLSSKQAYNALENDCTLAGVLFKEFLRKHGHRCVKELDISSESWGMNPESLIPILQTMVNSPNILKTRPKEEISVETAISNLKTPVSGIYKTLLKIILPNCWNAVRQREKTKSMFVKTHDWLRKTTRHLGELLVQDGKLPSSDLIYFLTLGEIDDFIRKENPGLVSRAVRRKKLHPKLDALRFPELINGIPKPIPDEQDMEDFSKLSSKLTVKGTPVCQGKVTATARIVKTFSEASFIQSGDILITYSTDIGWSPYFPLLSGIVTVLGGLISHGAVVAREYGLPCIVGAQDAMSVFKSGDIVTLDGTAGTITKIGN